MCLFILFSFSPLVGIETLAFGVLVDLFVTAEGMRNPEISASTSALECLENETVCYW